MSPTKIAFDTNVWIYLLDKKSPHHNLTKQVFEKAEKAGIEIVVAQQNLLELIEAFINWYHFSPSDAIREAEMILDRDIKEIQPLPKTFNTYLALAACLKKTNNFDLYLAATLLDNGITKLVTNDKKGFFNIKGLQVYSLEGFIAG